MDIEDIPEPTRQETTNGENPFRKQARTADPKALIESVIRALPSDFDENLTAVRAEIMERIAKGLSLEEKSTLLTTIKSFNSLLAYLPENRNKVSAFFGDVQDLLAEPEQKG